MSVGVHKFSHIIFIDRWCAHIYGKPCEVIMAMKLWLQHLKRWEKGCRFFRRVTCSKFQGEH